MLLLLSRFSCVQLCVTPQTAAHQAPPSLGFSISKETINQIREQIPGIKTGFDSEAKPWTSEEQKKAIKDYHEDMCKKSTL